MVTPRECRLSLRLMDLSLGESQHSLGVTKNELECLQGYETGVSFQEVFRMIPHHPTENSKTEENVVFNQPFSLNWVKNILNNYQTVRK